MVGDSAGVATSTVDKAKSNTLVKGKTLVEMEFPSSPERQTLELEEVSQPVEPLVVVVAVVMVAAVVAAAAVVVVVVERNSAYRRDSVDDLYHLHLALLLRRHLSNDRVDEHHL